MNNSLGFFKVYLPPPKGPERLPIPSAFVKHVKGAIPDKAFLRNCHGKLWPVVVTKVGNQLCFKDGWVKFVEDNSVEVGNFLVFDYDGNYVFDFKLFGRTECEIKMIGSSGFKVKEEKEEEEKVKKEEEEEEDELEAKTLRKKTEKGKSEKSTKGLKKIKQGTNCLLNLDGNKGKVTIKDKGGNKRAYRMEIEDEEGDELEAKTLRKKIEKRKSEKSTKGLKKINQGTSHGNKGKATIKDKGGNKRAYRMVVEDEEEEEEEEEEETDDDDEEDDKLEAKTLRKKTEKGKSEKSTKGLKKINQRTNYGNKGKATIKDKGGNKRAYRMEVEDEEEETDDDEEEDELEATTLRKKTAKGKSEKSTKGLKKINQGTSCLLNLDGNKRKATIKDKGGNKRAYTMEVVEEEETDDDDEEEDELEAKALRKKTENGKREKSTEGLKKIDQGTGYGNKGKATIKGKGGNKRVYTMEVEDEEEETDDDGDDDDEDELEAKTLRKKTENGKREQSAMGFEKISQGTSYGNKGKAIKDKGGNKRADTTAVEDDEDVFKYGMVSWPKNPYFVAKLRSTRRNELYVPMDVIRDHNLKLPSNLILLDEEGRKWSTRVVQWKDGRTWLTVGWKAFCKWNNLKWEDRCICEFIRGRGRRGIFMKMCILRAGSWLPKKDSHTELRSPRSG